MAKEPAKSRSRGHLSTLDTIVSLGESLGRWWPWIVSFFGGGAMTWLASLSPGLEPWQWGAIGCGSFLIIYLVLVVGVAGWSWAYERRAVGRFTDRQSETTSINPLDRQFVRQIISLRDFWHPFPRLYRHVHFTECDISGPGAIALVGFPQIVGTESLMRNCEIVVVRAGAMAFNAIQFDSPVFKDCTFYNIAFYLTATDARRFAAAGKMNIISDGTFGEIK